MLMLALYSVPKTNETTFSLPRMATKVNPKKQLSIVPPTKVKPLPLKSMQPQESYNLGNRSHLLYNIPHKSGTRTTLTLLKRLAKRNQFKLDYVIKEFELKVISESDLELKVQQRFHRSDPYLLAYHTCYRDYSQPEIGLDVKYISIIRDPIERFISFFYFKRKEARASVQASTFDDQWLDKDLDECVAAADPECLPPSGSNHSSMNIWLFCGCADNCFKINNRWAFNQAKRNFNEKFAVVGVLEKMVESLSMFEDKLPQFFKSALPIYKRAGSLDTDGDDDNLILNENEDKKEVSEETKQILRRHLAMEVDFYQFVVDILDNY